MRLLDDEFILQINLDVGGPIKKKDCDLNNPIVKPAYKVMGNLLEDWGWFNKIDGAQRDDLQIETGIRYDLTNNRHYFMIRAFHGERYNFRKTYNIILQKQNI